MCIPRTAHMVSSPRPSPSDACMTTSTSTQITEKIWSTIDTNGNPVVLKLISLVPQSTVGLQIDTKAAEWHFHDRHNPCDKTKPQRWDVRDRAGATCYTWYVLVMPHMPDMFTLISRGVYQQSRDGDSCENAGLPLEGGVPPVRLWRDGLDLLQRVATMHKANIAHRDIKPENVLIAQDGSVLLADFEFAVYTGHHDTHMLNRSGTRAYAAPELFGSSTQATLTHDELVAMDVWATCVTILAMVTSLLVFGKCGVSDTDNGNTYAMFTEERAEFVAIARTESDRYDKARRAVATRLHLTDTDVLVDFFVAGLNPDAKMRIGIDGLVAIWRRCAPFCNDLVM
jgi:hypothetical protein